MVEYDVLRHPIDGYQAVKRGFSWPACFFTVFWALFKWMWSLAFILAWVWLLLRLFQLMLFLEGFVAGVWLMNVALVAFCAVVGFKANEWWRNDLVRRGFEPVGRVPALTPGAAIAAIAREEGSQPA